MDITINEFRKRATPKQNEIIGNLLSLAEREIDLCDKINEAHAPYKAMADRERSSWGIDFSQIADLVIEQEIAPRGYAAAAPYQRQLDEVRTELKQTFIEAGQEGLNCLGFVQRHYQHYVGKPLPR